MTLEALQPLEMYVEAGRDVRNMLVQGVDGVDEQGRGGAFMLGERGRVNISYRDDGVGRIELSTFTEAFAYAVAAREDTPKVSSDTVAKEAVLLSLATSVAIREEQAHKSMLEAVRHKEAIDKEGRPLSISDEGRRNELNDVAVRDAWRALETGGKLEDAYTIYTGGIPKVTLTRFR